MQNFQKYFLAANDANLFETNEYDKSNNYFDLVNSSQITLEFTNNSQRHKCKLNHLIELTLIQDKERCIKKDITKQTYEMLKCRLNGHVSAYFADEEVSNINHRKISAFISYLQQQKIGAVTINQYLGLLKRVLYVGVLDGIVEQIPIFPKIKSKSIPRGSFSISEYIRLLRISKSLTST